MSGVQRRQIGRRVIALGWIAMFCAFFSEVQAGKDKFTLAPTTSWWPTAAPSTRTPTLAPTWTSQPSSSERPSQRPVSKMATSVPLAVPVVVETPTLPVSPTMPTVAVKMPQLTFVLQTDGMVEEEELKADLAIFLSNYLSQGTYKDSFRFLNLSTTVDQGNNVLTISTLSGEAYFDAASDENLPSVEVLANILSTYFSYWGDQNLRDYLIEEQLPVKEVTDVIVNGEKLTMRGDLTPDSAGSPDTDSETDKSSSNDDSDQFNTYAIAGIVIGGLVVVLAIALFMHTRRRQKRSSEEKNEGGVVVLKPISEGDVEDELKGQINTFPSEDSKDVDPDVITVDPSSPTSPPMEEDDALAAEPSNEPPMINLPVQIRLTQPPQAEDDYDGGAYSSDGDIISVAESLLYRDQDKQGPLFNVRSMGGSSAAIPSNTDGQSTLTAPETPTNTPPRGASVRPAQHSVFQYDASRLDQVISQAKNTQQEQ